MRKICLHFLIVFSIFSASASMAQGSLRADVYEALDAAKIAQDEGRLDDAFIILNKLKARSGKKSLKPYETIQLHNFYAYAWLAKENYPKALGEFKKVLAQDKVPEAIRSQTQLTMAQLYLATEQPDNTIAMLKKWLSSTKKPTPDAYVLMSQAYLQKKAVSEALSPLLKAFKLAKAQGRTEKENWYALLQYIYNDKKDFKRQEKALEVLVERWPKAQWWLALGGAYAQQEKEAKQLYAMDAAYQQGLFTRGEYIVSMGQLLAMQGAPFYAAKAMKKGLDAGLIEESFKNNQRIASYYQQAQESELALQYYKKAIEQAEDGEVSLRIAYVYMRQYDYTQAEKYIAKAIKKGGLKNKLQAELLLGEALFHS
ncbi:MAG: hypothetical protein KAG18_03640, partial [Sinobacterium sp.]|nr:hypothetical protein [Sinobacterium sp.]